MKKGKKRDFKIISLVIIALMLNPLQQITAEDIEYTVDDVRDIVGAARVDKRYTEIEKEEIEERYKEVEQYNNMVRLFKMSEEIDVDSKVEEEYSEYIQQLERLEGTLKEMYIRGARADEVLQKVSEIEVIKYKIGSLKETGYVVKLEYQENEWARDYIKLQETLDEISKDYVIGFLGLGLRSPVYSGLEIKSPFGFRLNEELGKLEYHKGVDIRGVQGEPILNIFNGVVSSIEKEGTGLYSIEVLNGKGLKTKYSHLESHKVKVGESISQYKEIGSMGQIKGDSYIHFEVELDGEKINPIYLYGQEGLNSMKVYISKNPDRNREIHEVEEKIKNKPTEEREKEEEKKRYERVKDVIEGEINGSGPEEEIKPKAPWEHKERGN